MIYISFRFDATKKMKSLGNIHDIEDQITEGNDDNTLGTSRANLELKIYNMFIIL